MGERGDRKRRREGLREWEIERGEGKEKIGEGGERRYRAGEGRVGVRQWEIQRGERGGGGERWRGGERGE